MRAVWKVRGLGAVSYCYTVMPSSAQQLCTAGSPRTFQTTLLHMHVYVYVYICVCLYYSCTYKFNILLMYSFTQLFYDWESHCVAFWNLFIEIWRHEFNLDFLVSVLWRKITHSLLCNFHAQDFSIMINVSTKYKLIFAAVSGLILMSLEGRREQNGNKHSPYLICS